MLKRNNEYIPSPDAILEYISKYYNLDISVIRGQQRIRDAVAARQIAMYVVREITQLPMASVGAEFGGRDHSTVVYATQQVEKNMTRDPRTKATVEDIIKNIRDR